MGGTNKSNSYPQELDENESLLLWKWHTSIDVKYNFQHLLINKRLYEYYVTRAHPLFLVAMNKFSRPSSRFSYMNYYL